MPYPNHCWHPACSDCPHQRFVVKDLQIIGAAATAHNRQYLRHGCLAVAALNGTDDPVGCASTLHRHRIDIDLHAAPALANDGHKVGIACRLRATHHGNVLGPLGYWSLAL